MINLERYLKIAYKTYKRNFISVIVSVIVILGVFLLFLLPASFLIITQNQNITMPEQTQIGSIDSFSDFQALFLANPLNFFIALGLLVSIFLSSGLVGICYHGIKKRVEMKTFFKTLKDRGISYFSATLLILLIFLLIYSSFQATVFFLGIEGSGASLLNLLAGLVILLVSPFFVLYSPSVISGKNAIHSIRESVKLGRKNYLGLFVLIIVFYVLSLVEIIPVIGLVIECFFLFPLLQIIFCSIYINETKSKRTKRKIKKRSKK